MGEGRGEGFVQLTASDKMILDRLIKFFTSLKLTVALLALGLVLVFMGTLAQESLGLYAAQERFFQSFFVDGASFYAALHKLADMIMQGFGHPLAPLDSHRLLTAPRIPVFPGGYLVGGLLLINLFSAHLRYYQPGKRKIGIAMIHLGVVLLLLGQFLTDRLSRESSMHIRTGESKNYSESPTIFELAITDTSDAESEKVMAIPRSRLARGGDISDPAMPFTVRVKTYYGNSTLTNSAGEGFEEVKATTGGGQGFWWRELPRETEMQRRDIPSALVEILTPQGSLGTWLVSGYLARQPFIYGGRNYDVELRPERFYKPFSLRLLEFRFDRYPGTQIPKNYSSRVRLQRPETGEDRELLIYMNSPLRYLGETFYQADFDHEDEKGTILQVVHNPGWLTPYFACCLVAAGLIVQFLTHLFAFAKRRTA